MAYTNPLIPTVNIINATPDTQLVTLGTFTGRIGDIDGFPGVYATGCILQCLSAGGAPNYIYANVGTVNHPNFVRMI